MLNGKKILIGVTGGIAAYKSCLLVRELQKRGAEVRVVMTEAATHLVGIETFKALTRHPVPVKLFSGEDYFQHIELGRWADLFIVSPCTANTMANLAVGQTPDLLSLIWLACAAPKAISPAMNTVMWHSPAVQDNLAHLRRHGVAILEPAAGELACGEVGSGRSPEPEDVADFIEDLLFPKPSHGTALISMGRTEEPLDPVRYITNRSSGKTGLELARALRAAGYAVRMVAGPCDVRLPSWLQVVRVRTVRDMQVALEAEFAQCQVLIMAASIADFRPATVAQEKIKDSRNTLNIELAQNPDLLKHFAQIKLPGQQVVGFALESANPEQHALEKLRRKGCDVLILNTPLKASSGIGHNQVEYSVLHRGDTTCPPLRLGDKSELARDLIAALHRKS